jgi:hypothetical protein
MRIDMQQEKVTDNKRMKVLQQQPITIPHSFKALWKSAKKEVNLLSSNLVQYCAISGPIQELSKLAANATDGMATVGAEALPPFSEGLLPDLVQKRWVAGRENEAGSLA